MNLFSILGRSALIVTSAVLALGCSHLGASGNGSHATTASSPAAVAAAPPMVKPVDNSARISVEEAKKLIDAGQAVMVDVRGTEAYNASHIKGALDHGIGKIEANDFKGLPKDKRLIVYCSCSSEQTSARAASVLTTAGFKDVAALVGGTSAWQGAGYDMVIAPASPAPAK